MFGQVSSCAIPGFLALFAGSAAQAHPNFDPSGKYKLKFDGKLPDTTAEAHLRKGSHILGSNFDQLLTDGLRNLNLLLNAYSLL